MMTTRNKRYQLIAIAKKQLNIDDETHQEILKINGAKIRDGKYSAKSLSVDELFKVVNYYCQKGFKVKLKKDPNRPKNYDKNPKLKLINSYLKTLKKDWSYALYIIKRTTKLEKIEWTSDYQINLLIKALRMQCDRAAKKSQ